MNPLAPNDIYGNWATPLLPINPDESIDYARLTDEVDYLVSTGVNGIYTNGTAGEFYAQSEAEFDRIQSIIAPRCEKAGVPFQIGASHMSSQISLERIKRAVQYKPGAIQVVLSDWFPLTDDEIYACLSRMAEAADPIGLVLYNPPQAKRVLKPAEYVDLIDKMPALVGIKVAGGDEAWYRSMSRVCDAISVFVPGHHLATGVTQGAAGAYSNVACLHPVGGQLWYDMIVNDIEVALELETRIQQFMADYIAPFITDLGYANQAADKLLAAIGGWADVGTRLRWPYRWISEEEATRLRPVAEAMVPELFPLPADS
jgi:4-hydroxy-tetrahydrodipicolinate synthase